MVSHLSKGVGECEKWVQWLFYWGRTDQRKNCDASEQEGAVWWPLLKKVLHTPALEMQNSAPFEVSSPLIICPSCQSAGDWEIWVLRGRSEDGRQGSSDCRTYLPFDLSVWSVRAVEYVLFVSAPQIFMKYGRQRWKLKGKIEVNGKQSWDGEEVVFLPLIAGLISIKVQCGHCHLTYYTQHYIL